MRARDLEWGVRGLADVAALAEGNGMTLGRIIDMPANNPVPAFAR